MTQCGAARQRQEERERAASNRLLCRSDARREKLEIAGAEPSSSSTSTSTRGKGEGEKEEEEKGKDGGRDAVERFEAAGWNHPTV